MDGALLDRPRQLLVSGHVNIDRFLSVDAFPAADRTVPIVAHRVALGGTGANIVRVASRYGVACGLVARVGDSFPAEFLRRLRDDGIDLRGLEEVRGVPTPTCFIVEDRSGAQRTLIDQGPMGDARKARVPSRLLGEYSWLHLTTGDPEFQLALLRAARTRGARVTADPAQEIHYRWDAERFERLVDGSEVFFGNRSEVDRAAAFLGGSGPADLLEHVGLVIRTEGRDGATAFSRAGRVHVAAEPPRRVRSFVGAGEAFRGGFYAAWFEGEPMRGCLVSGTRAARRWIEGAA